MTLRRVREPIPERRIWNALSGILSRNRLCSISTVTPGGRAHVNSAFFAVSPHLEFYFLSDPGSLHCRNLLENPSMAMAIFDSHQRWDAPGRGIQLMGKCYRARGKRAERAAQFYGDRFPQFARWMKGRTKADRRRATLLRSYAFYRFVPTRVKIFDEAEFGGAAFVIAAIHRARSTSRRARAQLAWQETEVLVPGPAGADKS
jgi:uncharacterized protein YhbP (UPF0306 family)